MPESTGFDTQALLLTLRLSLLTAAILLVIAVPLAAWLVLGRSRTRPFAEAVAMVPLVLPPTVLGYYLLVLLGPRTGFGRLCEHIWGHPLAFSFDGLVVGSVIYSLPFARATAGCGLQPGAPRAAGECTVTWRGAAAHRLERAAAGIAARARGRRAARVCAHCRRVRRGAHDRRRYSRLDAHAFDRAARPGAELPLRLGKPDGAGAAGGLAVCAHLAVHISRPDIRRTHARRRAEIGLERSGTRAAACRRPAASRRLAADGSAVCAGCGELRAFWTLRLREDDTAAPDRRSGAAADGSDRA